MERKKNKTVEKQTQELKAEDDYPDSELEEITEDLLPDEVPEVKKASPKNPRKPKTEAQKEAARKVFKEANDKRSAAAQKKKEDKALAVRLLEAKKLLEEHATETFSEETVTAAKKTSRGRGRPKKELPPVEESTDESASESDDPEPKKLEKTRKPKREVVAEADTSSDESLGALAPPKLRRSSNIGRGRTFYTEIKPLFL